MMYKILMFVFFICLIMPFAVVNRTHYLQKKVTKKAEKMGVAVKFEDK